MSDVIRGQAIQPIDRAAIERLQAAMLKLPQSTKGLETHHYFANGMYARELFRPAGTLIVGRVHKQEHFYIVLEGEVTIAGPDGPKRIKAPAIMVSAPGTKRAVFAHEDTRCLTIHRTSETDLDAIEAELLEPDESSAFDIRNELKAPALEQP